MSEYTHNTIGFIAVHHQQHRRLSPAASLRDEIEWTKPKQRSLDEATLPGSRTQYFKIEPSRLQPEWYSSATVNPLP
ncbi:MAG: hypothetical protein QY319_11315 [Candidatus Kapaibacterium sp.]|nr:hypothetical protein [Chlorobiota bacterium]WKZ77710.1 MAG: hypothetical protein QY319_11315 [Candidatus Kapabacteria bacterium]